MSAALQGPAESGVPPRKRITRDEYHRMIDAGVFGDQRVELINGELIDKMAQKPPHARTIRHVNGVLTKVWPGDRVQVQAPIEVLGPGREYSEPEPDFCILAGILDEYRERHPRGNELLLVIEVSDTTVRYDLTSKRDLYAHGGVPEYWVLDLNLRRVVVHRALSDGRYGEVAAFSPGERVVPSYVPGTSFLVEELLPA